MELSVREAAVLTGRPPRTLRAQLARGEMPGVKRNGRWVVDRRHLPLTEDQRRRLEHKSARYGARSIGKYRDEYSNREFKFLEKWW